MLAAFTSCFNAAEANVIATQLNIIGIEEEDTDVTSTFDRNFVDVQDVFKNISPVEAWEALAASGSRSWMVIVGAGSVCVLIATRLKVRCCRDGKGALSCMQTLFATTAVDTTSSRAQRWANVPGAVATGLFVASSTRA